MSSSSSFLPAAATAALLTDECGAAEALTLALTTDYDNDSNISGNSNSDKSLEDQGSDMLLELASHLYAKVAAMSCLAAAAASGNAAASAYSSGTTGGTATLKQHQRLLARRHLNLSRRVHPRMSTLEAKMVVCSFNTRASGISLEERRLADESAFWEETVASVQKQ